MVKKTYGHTVAKNGTVRVVEQGAPRPRKKPSGTRLIPLTPAPKNAWQRFTRKAVG
ncbi:MAG: hypothetical protein QOH97_5305 [Actinoplanes sp.]|jgi:hypothetical protein|nr:hypothetical protein [Actinoplanes sp.]